MKPQCFSPVLWGVCSPVAAVVLLTCSGCGRAPGGETPLNEPPPGFTALFNGRDLTGWKTPEGDNGHWKVVGGVIDYDAASEATGGNDARSLWSEDSFRDFELLIDWRLKTEPGLTHRVPMIDPDGTYRTDAEGNRVEVEIDDLDSGIYLRGASDAQVNIWMWPVGSGEVWAYRNDPEMPPEVRAACTPTVRADRPRGEWNTFRIRMVGDRLSVELNGVTVIEDARLPGVPVEGPIALQSHGSRNREGEFRASYGPRNWSGAPSLIQFRNIFIRRLEGGKGEGTSPPAPRRRRW